MSFLTALAVLGAAILHVSWNILLRRETNKVRAMFLIVVTQALMGLPFALIAPLPQGIVWLPLIASSLTHLLYQFFLLRAYHYGDLSRVYPIARGTAPLFVLLANILLLGEPLSQSETLGILGISTGILLLSFGAWRQKENLRLIPLALCSAVFTALYGVIDAIGARMLGDVLTYIAWTLLLDGIVWTSLFVIQPRNRAEIRNIVKIPPLALLGGPLSFVAYAIVLWATTQAPIALVAALRETSVLFSILLGALLLGEKVTANKLLAGIIILSGIAMIQLG